MAILPIQLFGDFSNPSTDPEGIDTRRDGDDNIRALAASLKLSFPALTDTAVTRTGVEINDLARKSTQQDLGGRFSMSDTSPIIFSGDIDQQLRKTGTAGNLQLTTASSARLIEFVLGANTPVTVSSTRLQLTASPQINSINQPASVACATITVPAATGNPATLSNQSGGATGWSAVWTSTNQITLTHSTGSTAYLVAFGGAPSGVNILTAGKANNTLDIGASTDVFFTGQTIDVTITRP